MMKMQHIQGILVPRNPAVVSPSTRLQIMNGVHRSHLFLTIKDVLWDKGIIEINSYTAVEGGHKAALSFLDRLGTLINFEGVDTLRLKGSLMITIDSEKEPAVLRATVKDGEVSYQQAKLTWDKEFTPLSRSDMMEGFRQHHGLRIESRKAS